MLIEFDNPTQVLSPKVIGTKLNNSPITKTKLNTADKIIADFLLNFFIAYIPYFFSLLYYKPNSCFGQSIIKNFLQKNKDKTLGTQQISIEKKFNYDFELIMRDYDRTIELVPDFEYAWFNKANMLCSQKDFRSAIKHYSKAIEINPEFAEAYFNRGLTLIFIGDDKDGLSDLSKAGELGIYQSYNILKRLKK